MSYETIVLSDTPIRYWQMRETAGIVADDVSTSALDGDYMPNSGGEWTGGEFTQIGPISGFSAPTFDGTTGYLETGNVPLSGVAHLSVEFFLMVSPAELPFQMIFNKGDTTIARYQIITGSVASGSSPFGLFIVIGSATGTAQIYTGAVLTHNAWNHCAVVYDGTLTAANRIKIYVNGSLVASTIFGTVEATLPTIVATDSQIAATLFDADFFGGNYIAEVAIYNYSLTALQISNHYASIDFPGGASLIASVPAAGNKVDITFSLPIANIPDTYKVPITANGVKMEVSRPTGAGLSWSLPLTPKSGWIPAGHTVKVSCVESILAVPDTVTAVNNSTTTLAQKRFIERGFGVFVHLVAATWDTTPNAFTPVSLPFIQAIDMPSYDMEQWFTSVIVPSGARYALFTAKHLQGLAWWHTAAGNYHIGQTAFGVAHPTADLVRDWVRLCRKYNLGVGLYLCFSDLWWTTNRPGADGGYSSPAYDTYITQQVSELFSNYGKIDILWADQLGLVVPYADFPYSSLTALRDALQPECVICTNNQEYTIAHSDIAEFEGSLGMSTIPPSTNTVPSEYCEDSRTDDSWVWNVSNEDDYKDVFLIAKKIGQAGVARTAYLLNFPPNDQGVMPTSSETYAAELGVMLGKGGLNPVLPALPDVRGGIDRGDGQEGAFGGGVNGSAILGVL